MNICQLHTFKHLKFLRGPLDAIHGGGGGDDEDDDDSSINEYGA